MFGWLKEWYEIRREYRTPPCTSCDNLRMEVERLRQDNSRLLDRILTVPEAPKEPERNERAMLPVNSNFLPWRVKKQMLEAEDREKAKLLRQAPQTVTELEKSLGVAEAERENQDAGQKG